jgi:hypothetical protein
MFTLGGVQQVEVLLGADRSRLVRLGAAFGVIALVMLLNSTARAADTVAGNLIQLNNDGFWSW